MTGEFLHTIDNKGRLILPAQLRKELGEVCYVTITHTGCLSIYSQDSWDAFQARVNAMPIADAVRLRVIFSNTLTCEPDSQGRIIISQKLRDFAKIDKNVTVIGFANHAEIWDRERYEELERAELNQETINAAVKELGI